jgi:hypothetical protein
VDYERRVVLKIRGMFERSNQRDPIALNTIDIACFVHRIGRNVFHRVFKLLAEKEDLMMGT